MRGPQKSHTPRDWKKGLMCTHNGPQRPVSHSNPDSKRGVNECALEGRAAELLVERPCGISCRFFLFFYIYVCAEQRESEIIEHASDEHRLLVLSAAPRL